MLCENVYKTFTHKSNKPDSSHWLTPYENHLLCTLSPTNLLPTVGYFRFLYVSSSSVKTPLSSQVVNLVFIPVFNVISSVLSQNLGTFTSHDRALTVFHSWLLSVLKGTRKSRWSRVGTSKIILDFYSVICLVRWIMVRIGKHWGPSLDYHYQWYMQKPA